MDQRVVDLGLSTTKSKAQALILAGDILVDGENCAKAGHAVSESEKITLRSMGPRYVSRGGIKLAGALDHFDLQVENLTCLDVGASTGGFTDVLLQRGAKHVFTIDVGKGQLDPKLRNDPRVTWSESFHARELDPAQFNSPIELAVVDVSFISLKKVLPFVLPCIRQSGLLLALIKPQFEADRKAVAGTGVVKDEVLRKKIVKSIVDYASNELKLGGVMTTDSVLPGPKGNQETFVLGQKRA